MQRRQFLGSLAGLASALVLDPEKLLWVPGARLISIPAPVKPEVFRISDMHMLLLQGLREHLPALVEMSYLQREVTLDFLIDGLASRLKAAQVDMRSQSARQSLESVIRRKSSGVI
jgi:hypothetical protein